MFWKDSKTSSALPLSKLSEQPILVTTCTPTSHKHRKALKDGVNNLQLFPSAVNKRQNFLAMVEVSRKEVPEVS